MNNIPITELIRRRFSCRSYLDQAIAADHQRMLANFLTDNRTGPLGTTARFALIAANEDDRQALKSLGTYGFIRRAAGFIAGAVSSGPKDMEDFGYLMENAILFATGLELGTCWLGGSFTKTSFARKIALAPDETMPAVTSIGYIPDHIQRRSGANRLPNDRLFFDCDFSTPLTVEGSEPYTELLEMVRWAPSATNRQPWRIVRADQAWHFYLRRTKGYGKDSLLFKLLRIADLQRVDLGIAMCHFELTARERGMGGHWLVNDPGIETPERTEYTVSWITAE